MLSATISSISSLTSIAGGLAASIAVGAFIGQTLNAFAPASDRKRRRDTAIGGLIGLTMISALFLLSGK